MDLTPRPFPARASAVAARGMVATSQPLATQAGLRALERGGNAIDAALAAAAVLCVVEPMSTGVGGDCFSLVWREGELSGLNASGRAPAAADPDAMGTSVPLRGPLSVTAPGAVAGWAALVERHGRLGLDRALADAIDVAERGFAVTPVIAGYWAAAAGTRSTGLRARASRAVPARPPRRPDRLRRRSSRRRCAGSPSRRPAGLYQRPIGEAICDVSWLEPDDLAGAARRTGSSRCGPAPAARGARAAAERPGRRRAAGARRLAEPFERRRPRRRRPRAPAGRGDEARVRRRRRYRRTTARSRRLSRRRLPRRAARPDRLRRRRLAGLRARCRAAARSTSARVDEDRNACSLIQSIFLGFGSLVVAPGTGDRAAEPRRTASRSSTATQPARAGQAPVPHDHPRPAAARRAAARPVRASWAATCSRRATCSSSRTWSTADSTRRRRSTSRAGGSTAGGRGEGWSLALEPEPLARADAALARRGHRVVLRPGDPGGFGGGQAVLVRGDVARRRQRARKDGVALGYWPHGAPRPDAGREKHVGPP